MGFSGALFGLFKKKKTRFEVNTLELAVEAVIMVDRLDVSVVYPIQLRAEPFSSVSGFSNSICQGLLLRHTAHLHPSMRCPIQRKWQSYRGVDSAMSGSVTATQLVLDRFAIVPPPVWPVCSVGYS